MLSSFSNMTYGEDFQTMNATIKFFVLNQIDEQRVLTNSIDHHNGLKLPLPTDSNNNAPTIKPAVISAIKPAVISAIKTRNSISNYNPQPTNPHSSAVLVRLLFSYARRTGCTPHQFLRLLLSFPRLIVLRSGRLWYWGFCCCLLVLPFFPLLLTETGRRKFQCKGTGNTFGFSFRVC